MGHRGRTRAFAFVAATAAACTGTIGDGPPGSSHGTPPRGSTGAGGSGGIIDPPPSSDGGTAACTPGPLAPTTRIVRLTHRQYDNTIRDLTGLDLHPSTDFLPDQHQAGYDRGIDLQVGDALGKAYRAAAEKIAAAVVATPSAYQKVVACDPKAGDSCRDSFVAAFGSKVFRRPLGDVEKQSYAALFAKGPDLVDAGDAFQKGVQVTIEAFLQSPKFLYRAELSTGVDNGLVALGPYEVAARLSYMLVNTTPDDTLLAAAREGALATPEQVFAQAGRLLASGAARETVRDFHHQWLDLDIYANKLTKDPALYPSVTPDLAPVLQNEVEQFVDAVTFDERRGFTSLVTAPFTFANRVTAPLYGLGGSFGDALQRVELDPMRRAGIVTQVGFLATRAFATQSSPIHRGVFIQRRILCTTIPDPPPNVPSLPPLDGTNIKTTRQQVDQHTAPVGCASCHHAIINPIGFGLENYDAVGQYRVEENGYPIDATGTLVGTEKNAPFSNGVEMARAIADSPEGRLCYAKNWFRYAFGRPEDGGDACALDAMAHSLGDDSYSATRLLADMTRTRAFLYRAPEVP